MAEFTPLLLVGVVKGTNTIWTTNGDSKVPIIDGKIKFYDKVLGCYFEIAVAQVKGQGVAAADRLTVVSEKHKNMIEALSHDEDWHTSEAIMALVFQLVGAHYFKEQHYRGTLSELLRKKVVLVDMDVNPPRYRLNRAVAKQCLESGKFE